jgi:hypothetical protein
MYKYWAGGFLNGSIAIANLSFWSWLLKAANYSPSNLTGIQRGIELGPVTKTPAITTVDELSPVDSAANHVQMTNSNHGCLLIRGKV